MEFLIVLAIVIGFLLGRFALVKDRKALRHEHIWKSIAAKNLNIYERDSADRPIQRKTQILQMCFCGQQKTQSIEGNWEKHIVLDAPPSIH